MKFIRTLGLGCAIGAAANSLNARLEFAETRLHVEADAGTEEAIRLAFRFVNTGANTVRVVDVKPSCGCTTTALEKTLYAPGEAGLIPVKFEVEALVGRAVRTIAVTTDESEENGYTLSLDVTVTEWFSLSPRLLFWRPNEEPAPKEFIVRLANDQVRLTGVEVSAESFRAAVKETDDPRRVAITVTPLTRTPGASAELTLTFAVGSQARTLQRKLSLRILPDASMPAPF